MRLTIATRAAIVLAWSSSKFEHLKDKRSGAQGASDRKPVTMGYKAIYAYPWDLVETGLSAAIDRFQDLGLDTVTVAGSYHAGKFLRPHGRSGKVYFPEDARSISSPIRAVTARSSRSRIRCSLQARTWSASLAVRTAWRPTCGWCSCTTRGSGPRISSRPSPTPSATDTSTSLPLRSRGARLRDRSRPRRHRILPRQRRVARDARLPALRARLPSRIRPQPGNRWLDSLLGLCFCPHCMAAPNARGLASSS